MRGLILAPLLLSSIVFAQFPDVIWEREGDGEGSQFGWKVYPMGDQNDDGFDDWAVFSRGTLPAGQPSEAAFDVFLGGNPPSQTPYLHFIRDPETTLEPFGGGSCGDLNGDGYIDWWTAWRDSETPDSITWTVHWGGEITTPELVLKGPLFSSIKAIGDYNCDGFDDLFLYTGFDLDYGAFFWGGDPMDAQPDLLFSGFPVGVQNDLPIAIGDINGDNCSDIVTRTNTEESISYVFEGASEPDTIPDITWESFDAYPSELVDLNHDYASDLVISRGSYLDVHFGGPTLSSIPDMQLSFPGCENTPIYLASAGDFNRDGYEDLAVIDDACELGWGKLAVYLGGRWMGSDPAFTIEGRTQPLDLVGIRSAIGLGDINNDGIEDLAIGATNDNTDGRRGKVVILSGDTTFVAPVNDPIPFHPSTFALHPCYPNPFNPSTTISFDLDHPGMVRLKVFDITGREVSSLIEESMTAGAHALSFDGSDLASGIYFYSLQCGEQKLTKKIVLIR